MVFDDPSATLFGPCDDPVAGEVVTVVPAPAGDGTTTTDTVAVADNDCWVAVVSYVGLDPSKDALALTEPAPTSDPDGSTIRWRLQIGLRAMLIHMDPTNKRVGRGWAACSVIPQSDGVYAGRIRDAFNGGELPTEYGNCQTSTDSTGERVPCSSPHAAELLALGDVLTSTGADPTASCRRLASRLLARDDPTVNGELTILARRQKSSYGDKTDKGRFRCLVASVDDRPLIQTVIGLGDRRVPFAG